jgi:DNA-binding transcriptional regulator GbsR (MarR family)
MIPVIEFIHWVGRTMHFFGLDESTGIIWGFLLLKGKPVTQKEIMIETGYSASHVSVSLSKLEKLGFITCLGRKGRRKLYRASKSFLDGLENYLKRLVDIEITSAIESISQQIDKLGDETLRRSAEKVLDEYEKLKLFLTAFISMMHKYKHLNKEQLYKSLPKIVN